MAHNMVAGGKYAKSVSGGIVKAIKSSGVIEKFIECVAPGGSVSFALGDAVGTKAYLNSQGKLGCGSTNDKNGGYRIDLQAIDGNPASANLQLQLNVNLNPSTVACVRIPVGTVHTPNAVLLAFYASMDAVKNETGACIAQMF